MKNKEKIYTHDKDGYLLENGERVKTCPPEAADLIKTDNKKVKMVTIQVPEGSLIVPNDLKYQWAKQVIEEYCKTEESKKIYEALKKGIETTF